MGRDVSRVAAIDGAGGVFVTGSKIPIVHKKMFI